MMGQQKGEGELFSYAINLEKREYGAIIRCGKFAAAIDFKFVREEVAHC